MAGKFSVVAAAVNNEMAQLFSRSIRKAVLSGLDTAMELTYQDSSNAAVHWMLSGSLGRPQLRHLGKVTDMRGTKDQAPIHPVGYHGDLGEHRAEALAFVRERELKKVLDRLVAGRSPEFKFYFYNAVGGDEYYSVNANIEDAGAAAVARTLMVAEQQITAGNTRKVPLK